MSGKQSGPDRLAHVDNQSGRVADELLKIEDDEVPAETRTPDGDFDHRRWLLAELEELNREIGEIQSLMDGEGKVQYDQ